MSGKQRRDSKLHAVQNHRTHFTSPKPRLVDRYDFSSDPESLVGFDVSIMWANKWYDGTVLRYNAASDRHLVRYHEDSEQAWYNLHRKTHFVKGPAAPGWRSLAHDPKLDADERKLPPHPSHEAEILDGDSSIEQRRLRYANHRQAVGGGMALSPATARPKAAETESRP